MVISGLNSIFFQMRDVLGFVQQVTSQTCLYNVPYKQAIKVLQKSEDIQVLLCTTSDCSMQYEYRHLHQFDVMVH